MDLFDTLFLGLAVGLLTGLSLGFLAGQWFTHLGGGPDAAPSPGDPR